MAENETNKTIKIRIENPCMGVPITYLDKHNPEQFEIVAFRKGSDGKDLVFTRERESTAVLQNSHQKTCCHQELTDGISTENAYTQESSSEEKSKIRIKIMNPLLGVPITYLDKHNPKQFEIIGADGFSETPPTKTYSQKEKVVDGERLKSLTGALGCVIKMDSFGEGTFFDVGYPVRAVYKRIFIRQRLQ